MSNDTKFALVVQRAANGFVANAWPYPDKYAARDAAHDKAKEEPGELFVVMETDEAYRAEPVVRTVYLSYPVQAAAQAAPMFDESASTPI